MISAAFANKVLTSLSSPALQFHTGDPGPKGKRNVAQGVDRRDVVFTEPVNGRVTNAEHIVWLGATRQETYTYFTAWDGDLLLFTGTVLCETVYAGDNVVINPGALTAYFTV